MKTVRVAFTDFWEGFDQEHNFIIDALREYCHVEVIPWEEETRRSAIEYLFYSCFGDEHLAFLGIRVFYTGENQAPDFNICDYAIGFDELSLGDRYIRYPLYLSLYDEDLKLAQEKHLHVDGTETDRKFCAMVVSNADYASSMRRDFFMKLSEYRQVDSGGRYLNNIGHPEGVADKNQFQKEYKFSMAFENSSHPGYVTEKLLQSFAAGTVPIYWGAPDVGRYFNEKAFIDCGRYGPIEDAVAAVRAVDTDDEQYLRMLREPAMDTEQVKKQKEDFKNWLFHIVAQDIGEARRRSGSGRVAAYEEELRHKVMERKEKGISTWWRSCIILVLILLVQIGGILFWGNRRGNYYWDEYFTFERAHYITQTNEGDHFIVYDKAFAFNEWLDVSLIRDTLTVTGEQAVLLNDSPRNIIKSFMKNPYAVLLNIFQYWFAPGQVSRWPAIIMNIVFFVLTQFLLFDLVRRTAGQNQYALYAVMLYGFSGMCISMSIFIRFYMMATFHLMLFTWMHLLLWKIKKWYRQVAWELLAYAAFYPALAIAQLTLFYGVLIFLFYAVALLKNRRYRQFFYYFLPIAGAGFYYLGISHHYYMRTLLHLSEVRAKSADGAWKWILDNLYSFSLKDVLPNVGTVFELIGRNLFGGAKVFAAFCIFLIVLFIARRARARRSDIHCQAAQPKREDRDFLMVIGAAVCGFLVLAVWLRLFEQRRYLSYLFPLLAAIAVLSLAACMENRRSVQFHIMMAMILVIQVLSTNLKPQIDMLYSEDRANMRAIVAEKADAVLAYAYEDSNGVHITYEASLYGADDSKILICNTEYPPQDELRENMLLVAPTERIGEILDMMEDLGYTREYIGETYRFSTYRVKKERVS